MTLKQTVRAGRVACSPCRSIRPRPRIITAAAAQPKTDVTVVPVTSPTNGDGSGKSPSPEPPTPPKIPAPKQKAFVQVFGQKLLDTGDDILMHASRAFQGHEVQAATDRGLRKIDGEDVYVSSKPIVLVLGFGWGAHSLAKVIDVDRFDVVILSPRNHFIFTPMLPSTAVGSVEFRSLLEPVRSANPYVTYFEAAASRVNVAEKFVMCESSRLVATNVARLRFRVPYEHLVVAVGEQPATFGVPGVRDHAFFMKEVSDSVRLRKRIATQFEAAEFLTDEEELRGALRFVVVGGGPTGVEFAGTMSDFLFNEVLRNYRHMMPFTEVCLVQSGGSILPAFDKVLQDRAAENLATLNVHVMTGVRVTAVREDELDLSTGKVLPYGVCLWSAGNCSRDITRQVFDQLEGVDAFRAPRPPMQKLPVDNFMRVVGCQNVYAAGDCSRIVSAPLPPTAQVAGQQGAYIARIINRNHVHGIGGGDAPYMWVEGKKAQQEEHTFDFLSLGIMSYIGNQKAVMQVDMDLDVNLWGQFAFLLWRSVYITKQVSMRNRVLILFDWLKTRVFGRDISLF